MKQINGISKQISNIYRTIVAFFVGIAIIIPGLSGGTILAATNTLEDVTTSGVEMITKRDKNKLFNIVFYGVGIIFGAGLAAVVISGLMEDHQMITLIGFLVFIIISLIYFVRENEIKVYANTVIITFVVSSTGLLPLSMVSGSTNSNIALSIFAGALAGLSMLMPGVSGSLFLVVLGKYYLVTDNIKNLEFLNADFILFATGIVIGTIITAVTLSKLFKTHSKRVNEISLGLILASAIVIIKEVICLI